MRCKKIEKWVSDEIDGSLSRKKQRILAGHLANCALCRGYKQRLEKLQSEAKNLPRPALAPGYWQESIAKLKANLEKAKPAEQKEFKLPPRQAPAFFPGRRWAWAGAASLLAVAAGLYFILFQSKVPLVTFPVAFADQVNSLYEKIGDNSDLEEEFNSVLKASIREVAGESDGEVKHLLYGNSFFIESLSDEEVQLLDSEISKVLNLKI
jgi:hypothetical protein